MPLLPFCKPAYHRIPWQTKMDRQARPCFFLNLGYNHGSDCFKVVGAETGRIVHSRDVTWHQPREPLISPAPTVGSGVPQSPSDAELPDYVHIQTATTTPPAAPVPAPDHAAPTPPRQSTAPLPDRVARELGHETDIHMLGRTRGETRAMREFPRNMGLMSHDALAQGITTRETFDEAFASTSCHHPTLTFRLPPPATCRPRLPLPRRNHRSTLVSGLIPGRGSSAASCRPTRSAPHSNQSVTLLTRSGCLLGNPMSLVGSVK